MNREIITTIKGLVDKYGSQIYTDSRKLKSFLNDYYPEKYAREKRLMAESGSEQRVPEDIINCKEGQIDDLLYNKLVNKLYDDLGISEELAKETVDSWCEIFSKIHIRSANTSWNNSWNNSYNAGNNPYSGNSYNDNANNFQAMEVR